MSMTNETNTSPQTSAGTRENKKLSVTIPSDCLGAPALATSHDNLLINQENIRQLNTSESVLSEIARSEAQGSQKNKPNNNMNRSAQQKRSMDIGYQPLQQHQRKRSPVQTLSSEQDEMKKFGCDSKTNDHESYNYPSMNSSKQGCSIVSTSQNRRQDGEEYQKKKVTSDSTNDEVLPDWSSRFDAAYLEPSSIQHQVYSLKDYSQVSGPTVVTNSSSRLLKSMSQDRKVEVGSKRMSECLISSSGHAMENSMGGTRGDMTSKLIGGKGPLSGGKLRNQSVTSHQLTSQVSSFIPMGSSQATSVQSLIPPTSSSSKSGGSNLLSESRIDRMRKLFVSPLSLRTSGGGTECNSAGNSKHNSNKTGNNPRLSLQAAGSHMLNVKPHHHIMHAMYKSRGHHSRRSPMRAQQKQHNSAKGVKSFRVYGCPLQLANNIYPITCFGRPDIYKQQSVPYILARLCNYIEETSGNLTHEGIFRVSGNARLMEKLRTLFDRLGDAPLESESVDVATSASMLKMYLRELPDPLIPTRMNYYFITLAKKYSALHSKDNLSNFNPGANNHSSAMGQNNEQSSIVYVSENNPSGSSGCGQASGAAITTYDRQRMAFLRDLTKLVRKLPIENYNLLKYLACFLYRISLKQHYNKMCAEALGIVFGPNVFRIRSESYKGLKEQELTNQIMASIISNYKTIFDCEVTDPLGNLVQSENLDRVHRQSNEERSSKGNLQDLSSCTDKNITSAAPTSPKKLHPSSGATTSCARAFDDEHVPLVHTRCARHRHHHHHHHHEDYESDDEARTGAGMYVDVSDEEEMEDEEEEEDEDEDDELDDEEDESDQQEHTNDDADVDEDDDLVEGCDAESYSPSSGSDSYCSSVDSDTVDSVYEGDIEGEQFEEEEDVQQDSYEYASNGDDIDEEELHTRTSECVSETSYTPSSSHDDSEVDEEVNEASGSGSSTGRNEMSSRGKNVSSTDPDDQQQVSSGCQVCRRRESAQLESSKMKVASTSASSTKLKSSSKQAPGALHVDNIEKLNNLFIGGDKQPENLGAHHKNSEPKVDVREQGIKNLPQLKTKPQASGHSRSFRASRKTRYISGVDIEPTSAKPHVRRRQQLLDDSLIMTGSDNALDQQRKLSRLMMYNQPECSSRIRPEHGAHSSTRTSGLDTTVQRQRHQPKVLKQNYLSRRRSSSASSLLYMAGLPSAILPTRQDRRKRSNGRDDQLQQQTRPRAHHSVRRHYNSRSYTRKSRYRQHLIRKSDNLRLTSASVQQLSPAPSKSTHKSTQKSLTDWKKGDFYVPEILFHTGVGLRQDLIWDDLDESKNEANDQDEVGIFQLRSYNSDETLLRSQDVASSATAIFSDFERPDDTSRKSKKSNKKGQARERCQFRQSLDSEGTKKAGQKGAATSRGKSSISDTCNHEKGDSSEEKGTIHKKGRASWSSSQIHKSEARSQASTSSVAKSSSMISLLGDEMTNFHHSELSLSTDQTDPLIAQVRITKELVKSLKRLLREGLANGYNPESASILMKLTSDSSSADYIDDYSACFVDCLTAKSIIGELEDSKFMTQKADSPQIDKTIQDQLCVLLQKKIDKLKSRFANLKYVREHYYRFHNRSSRHGKAEVDDKDAPLIQFDDDADSKTQTISDLETSSSFELSSTMGVRQAPNYEDPFSAQTRAQPKRATAESVNIEKKSSVLREQISHDVEHLKCKFGTLCPVEFVFNIEKQLASKRASGSRLVKLNAMSLAQLQSEKVELQKNLLRYEHWFGRPTTKLEHQLVGHLYERYKAVKIIKQRRQQQEQQ